MRVISHQLTIPIWAVLGQVLKLENFQSPQTVQMASRLNLAPSNAPCVRRTFQKQPSWQDIIPSHIKLEAHAPLRLCELVWHQQNRKLYQCAACEECSSKSGLEDHEKLHTASVTPRICETCRPSFKFLAHLVLHRRKHIEQLLSACSYCGKQFSTKDCHLMAHHRAKHIRLWPFVCEVCSKASELRKHMMVHTGERPFTCPRCGKTFKRKTRLREPREKACLWQRSVAYSV